jgi:hypothetical protein
MIRLDRLRELKDNWDHDGAVAPTEEAIALAEAILNTPGQAVPRTNGGVQIEWHCGGGDVEIVITPEGAMELE